MKKGLFLCFFILLNTILFSQSNVNSRLQGIWYGEESGSICHFMFKDNSLTMISDTGIMVGTFTIRNNIIRFRIEKLFVSVFPIWISVPPSEVQETEITFLFSANNLVVVYEGSSISLIKAE